MIVMISPKNFASDDEYDNMRQMLPLSPQTPNFGPPPGNFPGGPSLSPEIPPFRPPLGPGPVFPPGNTNGFAYIRFLYAATNQPPVNVSINGTIMVRSLRYSNVSPYYAVGAGMKRITAFNSGITLASINLPVSNGQLYTVAIVNDGNGIELAPIPDTPCNRRAGMACLRTVNLSANSSPVNVLIPGMGLVFRQVAYRSISGYRQMSPGNYTVYVTDFRTGMLPTNNQIQVAIIGGSFRPWITTNISLQRNSTYTLYLIGNFNGFPAAQALLVETDIEF